MKAFITTTLALAFSASLSAQWFPKSLNTESHLNSVHFSDPDKGWIAGSKDFIKKTTDGGETWTDDNIGFHGSSSNIWNSICVITANEIYAGGTTYNWDRWQTNYAFTTDAGASWEYQTSWGSAYGRVYEVYFIDNEYGWKVAYRSPYGRVYRTTTGIDGFNIVLQSDTIFKTIHFIDQHTGWIAGGEWDNGCILHSTDGGESWNELADGFPSPPSSVYFLNSSVGVLVGADSYDIAYIRKTVDGGKNWSEVNHPSAYSLHSVRFVSENTAWACGSKVENQEERGLILYTGDGGYNWTEQYVCDSLSALYEIFFIDNKTGWAVGSDGIILKTSNAGGTIIEGISDNPGPDLKVRFEPNPFTSSASFNFELKQAAVIQLRIYNQLGQPVYQYSDYQSPGGEKLRWNAEKHPAGMYFYTLKIGEGTAFGKLVKMK